MNKKFEPIVADGRQFDIKPYNCSPDARGEFPLYINVTGRCNAKCQFCSNEALNPQENDGLDRDKLAKILGETCTRISRISISGGEPLLNQDNLKDLLETVKPFNRRMTLNTNGKFLEQNIELLNEYKIESIQLSRHHYDDTKNNEIFGTETLPLDDLTRIPDRLKADLRINCLLIKDYIDNAEEVKNFLESISNTSISQVGFISMMQVNEFTSKNFVDYRDIISELNDDFILIDKMQDENRCTCTNHAYIAKNGMPIFVYFRYTEKYDDSGRSLFFDCNGLKEGY